MIYCRVDAHSMCSWGLGFRVWVVGFWEEGFVKLRRRKA